ncbi:hypothetical protein, partial [Yersinia pseudotuberculosis]|uniref:hypothetical protein n=1 Tax=Yersinia pseudotuberculosis TaxID=633 RepID=UPI001EE6D4B5
KTSGYAGGYLLPTLNPHQEVVIVLRSALLFTLGRSLFTLSTAFHILSTTLHARLFIINKR